MFKLRKYLKPFIMGFLIAIGLLFVQAICDLNLPNYMSKIVNVGIQQNGVERGIADNISPKGFEFLKLFMNDEDKKLFDSAYELKKVDFKNYQEAYVLKENLSAETLNDLEKNYGVTTWTMINTLKSLSQGESSQSEAKIDLSKLYQMQPVIASLPESVIMGAKEEALKLDNMLLSQSSTMIVSSLYQDLGIDMANYQTRYIIKIGIIMLGIALVSGIATVVVNYLSSKIASGVAKNLRNDIFAKVSNFSNNEFDSFSTASLITRTTNDVNQVQMLLTMGIRMLCYAPIMGVGGVIMAINKSTSMSWIIAAACFAIIVLIVLIYIIAMPKFKKMQTDIDNLNLVSRETLNGLMVIRAFGTSKFEKKRFNHSSDELANTNLFINRTMTFMMPTMTFLMNAICVLIIWVGSHQVAAATMQVGDMMAFMQYAMQITMSFLMIAMMFIFIPRAAVSASRIAEVLNTKPSILDPEKSKKINKKDLGTVEFKNVYFRYEGASEDVLENISFKASPGKTVAFIGSTGSGKSTLINLIPRFYDATYGEVIVDGVNVKELTQKELRSHIGYVPQKSVLMKGTIKTNIAYGNHTATKKEIEDAAKVAQAMEFINDKEHKFDSEISQAGLNVSGGQRQRLSIARALAINPDIYIFDDSFSALDFKTDAALRKELKKHTKFGTVLIVAQRVSTIMNADQIYVLDEGKIVGHGTHKELLKSCQEYYEIASSQLAKEELDEN